MLISVDMDDVIVDWKQKVLEYWNEDRPDCQRTLDQMKSWDVVDDLGEHARFYVRAYMRYPSFYQDIRPMPGAIEGMRALLQDHEVAIVTATPKSAGMAYEGKLQWIRKHIPEFPLDNFVSMKRKEWAPGDILVDDEIHNLEAFENTGRTAICFDRPWNQTWNGGRIYGWHAIVKLWCSPQKQIVTQTCFRCKRLMELQFVKMIDDHWYCDDCRLILSFTKN